MSEKKGRSGFVRSVITRILAIFIVVSIIITAVAFYTFTADVRKATLLNHRQQLSAVESTISDRMAEISSIAYNIGKDPAFFLEPIDDNPDSGREMSEMLVRYLVGNRFVEHLAYCRVAEPDKLYICTGERSLTEFFGTSFGIDKTTAQQMIDAIHRENKTSVRAIGEGENAWLSYAYPLPQLAENPRAHVLMMISAKQVSPLLKTLYLNDYGAVGVFDNDGEEIFRIENLADELDISLFVEASELQQEYKAPSGQRYIVQKLVSKENGWTYVSVLRYSDTMSGLASRQIGLIVFVLLLVVIAVILMMAIVISQYKPINKLVAQVANVKSGNGGGVGDERTLLSDRIATLKDDSEQKQRIETAYYEAEAANKAKSAFLSSMSHDIRTPMNAIIGITAIAREHIDDRDYVDKCLSKVQVSSEYLLDIINNVLDMSRIESGRIPIVEEPVMIPALVDSVVSLITAGVEAKSQKLSVDISKIKNPVVLGDSIHIVQVFVNILSNAVKFTPEGGQIEFSVRQIDANDSKSGNYIFAVSDTGVGIAPDFIDKVFDTFARAQGHAISETEGTGLGMAIAKKLVELMGGTIWCESELGRGTTFTVEMRMKYSDESEFGDLSLSSKKSHTGRARIDGTALDLSGKRILLVEDNAMNREIARHIIAETKATIVEAKDGKEAVEEFATHPAGYFDLIFMDIQMPVMNGYEAAAAIRAMDKTDAATVQIYAMTANTFDEDVRRVKAAGMNGHIGKPYYPATLYRILDEVLGKAE